MRVVPSPSGVNDEPGVVGGELFLTFEGSAFGVLGDLGGDDLEDLAGQAA